MFNGFAKKSEGKKLRDCEVCGEPVYERPYQLRSARTCRPRCAKQLMLREHPEGIPAWSDSDYGGS